MAKISELIARLYETLEAHGDLEVAQHDTMSGGWVFEPVGAVRVEVARFGLPTLGGEKNHVVKLNMDRVDASVRQEFLARPQHSVVILGRG